MKKILLGLLSFMMIFTFSGCGKKVTLDLDKIKDDLQNLETDKFSFQDIQSYAEDKVHMYSDDIYDTKEEFGCKSNKTVINALRRFEEFVDSL